MPIRRQLSPSALTRAQRIVELAWTDLPSTHRALLEAIGADQRKVVDRPLGQEIDDLRRSAGLGGLAALERQALDRALGAWVPDLRLILVDAGHEKHSALDNETFEAVLARIAWHEWGHALSVDRSTDSDVAAGEHLLTLAPEGVAENVRKANYGSSDFTHELVAEVYALLMARRRRGQTGRPEWLADEIWNLVTRVTGWRDGR